MEFVKFEENNDHEGETWVFWLQREGNIDQLRKLEEVLEQYIESVEHEDVEYELDVDVVLPEHDVDILVKHGGSGYMNNHTKVVGVLSVPDDLVQRDEYGADLNKIYKGGIKDLFKSA